MPRMMAWIEYDGTRYAGFQLQLEDLTIQYEVEAALEKLYCEPVRITGSGRTDAGVHAEYQIIHFDVQKIIPARNVGLALNRYLPRDIRVKAVSTSDDSFHARYSAIQRHYRYQIQHGAAALNRHQVWQYYKKLNLGILNECAEMILGEHDFTSFCQIHAEVKHKFCTVSRSEWIFEKSHLTYRISANRFLHSMVRSLVGTMMEAGKGRFTVKDFRHILESRDRSSGAVTAPPEGLILENVEYQSLIRWEWYSDIQEENQ